MEAARINASLTNPKGTIRLLYVTPEKLAKSKRIMAKLEKCNELKLLRRIAIDEVHCCSQWGHDFRPDYKFLNVLKRQFPTVPILGLTATATTDVIDDVKEMLGVRGALVFRAPFNRPNLFYSVRQKPAKNADMIAELVNTIKREFTGQSGIIYVFSRKEAEDVTEALRSHGIKARYYHADLMPESRTRVHESWIAGTTQVIVATVAFGMGIDKPNVRFVIHHSVAKSVETYYQESGRAGRDGDAAQCIIYYRLADLFRQSTMVCTETTGLPKLYEMLRYCLTRDVCRRVLLAEHFGESWEPEWCVAHCDTCSKSNTLAVESPVDAVRYCAEIRALLRKQTQKVTGAKLVDIWLKQSTKKQRLDQLTAERVVAELLLDGYLREDFHFTPYNIISYVMASEKALPNAAVSCSSSASSSPKKRKLDCSNNDVLTID